MTLKNSLLSAALEGCNIPTPSAEELETATNAIAEGPLETPPAGGAPMDLPSQSPLTPDFQDDAPPSLDLVQEVRQHIVEDEAEHAELRKEIDDVRDHLEAYSYTSEMLACVRRMEKPTQESLVFANNALSDLARSVNLPAPTFESIDGVVTTASMEGVIDFLKSTGTKIKNWFKDLGERMNIEGLRSENTFQNIMARTARLRKILQNLPEDATPPNTYPITRDVMISLFAQGAGVQIAAAKEPLEESFALGEPLKGLMAAIISDIKVLAEQLPVVLSKTYDDGGEAAAKEMIGMLKSFDDQYAPIKRDYEYFGGVTYKASKPYRPSVKVASWATPLLERLEYRPISRTFRTGGSFIPAIATPGEMLAMVDLIEDLFNKQREERASQMDDLREVYRIASEAYNKAYGMAYMMDHSSLTDEVWRTVDIASYVMMDLFNRAQNEMGFLRAPSKICGTALLFVIEEQAHFYVKNNR